MDAEGEGVVSNMVDSSCDRFSIASMVGKGLDPDIRYSRAEMLIGKGVLDVIRYSSF